MSQDVMLTVMNFTVVFDATVNLEMKSSETCNKCLDLEAKLVKKKIMVERDVYIELSNRMFKLDLESLSSKLLNNREAHIKYLKTTKEQADIIQGIVEQARSKQPLDSALDFASKHVILIQELLVSVRDTSPYINKSSEKLIAVTPQSKNKRVRFAEPVTLPSNAKQQVGSHNTLDSNKPMLTSTGLKSSTSASKS
ncbi:hypothetical protein Tco_0257047 [Tanacetum coccineum]